METVYVLWHCHPTGANEKNEKLNGIYGTEAEAKSAMKRLSDKPGFSSYAEGFLMDAYELGKDHWTEGYFTE